MVFVRLGRHEGLDEVDVALNALTDDLLPNDSVEEDIELDDDLFQTVGFVCLLFSHEEAILFL